MSKRDFVASIYVIHNHKVLLHFHKKLKKWLPPGGHLDEGETPEEGALRELLEETGIEAHILQDTELSINCFNAKSLCRPFLMLLEEIPAWKEHPAHQHIDHVFVGRVKTMPEVVGPDECRWYSYEEIDKIEDIFKETADVAKLVLKTYG